MYALCLLLLLTNAVMAAWILRCQRRIARLDDERWQALKALGLKSLNLERAYAHADAGWEPSQSQEAQILKLAALGKLMSGIAHEITNPLGVILGFAQSALRNMKAEGPLFAALKSIEREAGRCKNILHTLLFFSRLENGGQRSCDLNSVVEAALTMIEPYVKTKSVELRKELSEGLD